VVSGVCVESGLRHYEFVNSLIDDKVIQVYVKKSQ
jgi:hypothetical protein